MSCSLAQTWQQQLAAAAEAAKQQAQSHQQTLALLDQAHMQQLSKLQAQLLDQSRDDSACQSKLKLELAEQSHLSQQLQVRLSELERECHALQNKSTEEQAVTKMLLKQQADSSAAVAASHQSSDKLLTSHGTSGTGMCLQPHEEVDNEPSSAIATPSAKSLAERTLLLEADVLRKEARVLKERLAEAEAAAQELTQDSAEDERKSAAKLSQLEGMLSQLESKHSGTSAVHDQTVAAIQTKTSILLQQRPSGDLPSVCNSLMAPPSHAASVCCSMSHRHTDPVSSFCWSCKAKWEAHHAKPLQMQQSVHGKQRHHILYALLLDTAKRHSIM